MRRKHDKADGHVFLLKASSLQGAAVFINRFFLVVRHMRSMKYESIQLIHPFVALSLSCPFREKETHKGSYFSY